MLQRKYEETCVAASGNTRAQSWLRAGNRECSGRGGAGEAPERGDRAAFEPLAKLGDTFGGVGAQVFIVPVLLDAAEVVEGQAARESERGHILGVCQCGNEALYEEASTR